MSQTKEHAQAALAASLGVSRATVSKTLRHCSGVDSDLRLRILRAADEADLLRAEDTCDIYCIQPDIPSFFWSTVRRGILNGLAEAPAVAHRIKFNIISRLRDEETVLIYLQEAIAMHTRVLILAAAVTDRIQKVLQQMIAAGCLVLLLSEYSETPHVFYIGADSFSDGAAMARHYLRKADGAPLFYLTVEGNKNIGRRIAGFCDHLHTAAPTIAPRPLDLGAEHLFPSKTAPAHIAALLSKAFSAHPAVTLYLPFAIPGFSRAVDKAGLRGRIRWLCHDPVPGEEQDAFAVCTQNAYAQGLYAIQASDRYLQSARYPTEPFCYIPSSVEAKEERP